jgi:hypothetical protein
MSGSDISLRDEAPGRSTTGGARPATRTSSHDAKDAPSQEDSMMTGLAVAATIPVAGVLLFLVLPRLERWLDDADERPSGVSPPGSNSRAERL